jgi:DNA polymerase I-like protein with 3'-5' exonuclease and polymerase domains
MPERLADDGIALLTEAMEGVKHGMRVPLVADVHAADTWAGAK